MVELAPRNAQASSLIGVQPIAIGAVALVLVLFGIGSIALWRSSRLQRSFGGTVPETDRMAAARLLQARTAQVSEALVEKTKGMELTQQESIDQLQEVQDQLQTMRKQFTAQQADTKKLSDQVTALTEQVEGLRQSLASAQANEPAAEPEPRKRSKAARSANRKRHRSRG
jgi:ABC-type multidrug transport system fused ATPase/permease subunit